MLWHFRANLQQGSENFAPHLWQWELEDVETAQAHMGKLCKNIMSSSIIIAGTVKILYPLLLRKLFLWDYNPSSLQMKNHQAVRRTLEGQNEWRTSSFLLGPSVAGPGCWDGAVSYRARSTHWGAAFPPCLRGCSHPCAQPCISWPRHTIPCLLQPVPLLWLARVLGSGSRCVELGTAWHSCLTAPRHGPTDTAAIVC